MAWRFGPGVTGCLLIAAVLGAWARAASAPPTVRCRCGSRGWRRSRRYVVHQTAGVAWAYVVLGCEPPVAVAVLAIVPASGLDHQDDRPPRGTV